ncbi:hypothetical protein ACJJTC_001043 [Scirpophaga incertulas]
MYIMSRRSKIIELALAKSEINENAEEIVMSNSDNGNAVDKEVPNILPLFMETGNELLNFKYNLRQRSPVKSQNVLSVSKETEEIYSPIVSEYLPPDEIVTSALTPEADTESINDQIVENYINHQLEDVDHEIVQGENIEEQLVPLSEEQPIISSFLMNANILQEIVPDEVQNGNQQVDIESANNEQTTSTNKTKKRYPKKNTPGRKRVLNKENWKNSICKRKKNLGQQYINKEGKLIPKKEMKASCGDNCSRKCREAITENHRNLLFTRFWELGDHNSQMEYISRFVKRVIKKQVTVSTASSSRRNWSFQYYLFVDGQEIRTCKTMFLNTFSISDMWLQTLFKKIDRAATGFISTDKRGNHDTRKNAIAVIVKDSVRNHISQMPLIDSHYVRSRTSKKYLNEELSLPILYKLYLEWMNKHHSEQEVATLRQYREIFKTEFNIDFHKPKKDQCPRCDIFKNATGINKTELEYEQSLHIANKQVVRALKDSDKCRAMNSDYVVTACYDLQKILNTPQSEVSVFYYKRKLATYNFTIYDMGKRKGYCYLWDETIGRKGSNEISSFVFYFIKTKVEEGYKEFNFYSDSCGGQNKNRTVFAMYAYASKLFKININHHFFEVGHSQSEGDAMHALIERRKKNKIIYVPQQWVTLIRCAKSVGEPYMVQEVNQDMILDFKQLLPYYNNWEYDINNVKVFWSKIMHVIYTNDLPNIIKFQYQSLSDCDMIINLLQQKVIPLRAARRRPAKGPQNDGGEELPLNISRAYNMPLPISSAKYKDLVSLCKSNAIPAIYHSYYMALPHITATRRNDESDSD